MVYKRVKDFLFGVVTDFASVIVAQILSMGMFAVGLVFYLMGIYVVSALLISMAFATVLGVTFVLLGLLKTACSKLPQAMDGLEFNFQSQSTQLEMGE